LDEISGVLAAILTGEVIYDSHGPSVVPQPLRHASPLTDPRKGGASLTLGRALLFQICDLAIKQFDLAFLLASKAPYLQLITHQTPPVIKTRRTKNVGKLPGSSANLR
jgi:hypothetical protein